MEMENVLALFAIVAALYLWFKGYLTSASETMPGRAASRDQLIEPVIEIDKAAHAKIVTQEWHLVAAAGQAERKVPNLPGIEDADNIYIIPETMTSTPPAKQIAAAASMSLEETGRQLASEGQQPKFKQVHGFWADREKKSSESVGGKSIAGKEGKKKDSAEARNTKQKKGVDASKQKKGGKSK